MTKSENSSQSDDLFSGFDLDSDFNLICGFPSPIDAFAELKRYMRAVHQFLAHATAQQTVRLQARLKAETDPVAIGEFECELESIKFDESTVLPRLVWGGILVSIYAAFEFGVKQVLNHWQATVRHPIPFKEMPRKDFLTSAESYAKDYIGVKLFANDVHRARAAELKELRNSFAHRGSQLSTLSRKLETDIKKKVHPGVTLDVVEGQWVANARSAAYYHFSTESAIFSFADLVLEKCLAYGKSRDSLT